MSLVARILRPLAQINGPKELKRAILSALGGGATSTGIAVNTDSAMRAVAVFACVKVLSESVAQLPLHLYSEGKDKKKEKSKDHRLYSILHDQPNSWMTSYDFWLLKMAELCLRGNSLSFIVRVRDEVRELIPIRPDRIVKVEQDPLYRLFYTIKRPDGGEDTIPQTNIFHLRGLTTNGFWGLNPIEYARESIGLALATEKHGAKLFSNGARLGGILQHPKKISKDAADRLVESFNSIYAGVENAHKTALIEEGMTWEKVGMTAEDSQFLESRKFQRSEIAGFYRVPPHMIGDLEKATFSNIEHQDLAFVKHSLMPWLISIEKAIGRDLLSPEERKEYFAKFSVDALLRGDLKSRYDAHAVGILNGFLSPNEVRDKEDLNPYEGGDSYRVPLNTAPVDGDNNELEKASKN